MRGWRCRPRNDYNWIGGIGRRRDTDIGDEKLGFEKNGWDSKKVTSTLMYSIWVIGSKHVYIFWWDGQIYHALGLRYAQSRCS